MLKSWGVQVRSFEKSKWEIFERSELVSESDTLPPTPQPYLLAFRVQKLWPKNNKISNTNQLGNQKSIKSNFFCPFQVSEMSKNQISSSYHEQFKSY